MQARAGFVLVQLTLHYLLGEQNVHNSSSDLRLFGRTCIRLCMSNRPGESQPNNRAKIFGQDKFLFTCSQRAHCGLRLARMPC